jgi:ketosteroid isomerase-like protein
MKTFIQLASVLFLATILATPVLADVSDEVRCHEIAFSQSVENQDLEAFTSLIDPDARFVAGSVSRGIAEIANAWAVFFSADGPKIKWRPQIVEVIENGTLALSRGPYRMIAADAEGTSTEYWGTFNSIWRKQDDGSWTVVFDAGSESATAPSTEIQALLDQEVKCP